jgi:hypothetical protein
MDNLAKSREEHVVSKSRKRAYNDLSILIAAYFALLFQAATVVVHEGSPCWTEPFAYCDNPDAA